MDDAHDAEPEQARYIRLPWPLVATALVGVLVVALGAGLLANRYLRPQRESAPNPSAFAAVTAVRAPAVAPTPPTNPPAVAIATVVRAPTFAPTPPPTLPTPRYSTTTQTGAIPAAPLATMSSAVATPTLIATTLGQVSPELTAELDVAYKHYWEVRAEALLDLDSSRLSEVMDGDHLLAVEKLIGELRAENHALMTDVDHKYAILSASADDAEIADTYTDSSVYVDPTSHEELSQPVNDVLQEQYRLIRTDGIWRVVSLVRSP